MHSYEIFTGMTPEGSLTLPITADMFFPHHNDDGSFFLFAVSWKLRWVDRTFRVLCDVHGQGLCNTNIKAENNAWPLETIGSVSVWYIDLQLHLNNISQNKLEVGSWYKLRPRTLNLVI